MPPSSNLRARVCPLALVVLAAGCGVNKFEKEVATEQAAVQLARETAAGGYSLMTTK